MLKKYKLIGFDLDGTLVQTSGEYRHKLLPKVLKNFGINKINPKYIDKFWLEGERDKTVEEYFGLAPDKFWPVFYAEHDITERVTYSKPTEGALLLLNKLYKDGKTLVIISDGTEDLVSGEVELLPKQLFSKILALTSPGYNNKPDPSSLQKCLKDFSVSPEEGLYIGNSLADLAFAKNAGVDFMMLDQGENHLPKDLNCRKIKSFNDLLSI